MAIEDVSDILKHDYKPPLRDDMNNGAALDAQLERTTDSIVGDYAVIAMETGREVGVGARLERGVFPRPRSVPPKQATIKVKRLYGTFSVTRAEVEAMKTDVGAFDRAIPRRMRNLRNAITRWKSQMCWGDGSGRVAQCGTTTASTTVQLAATTAEQVLVNLAEGMQIDIGTNASPQAVAADREIVSVDFANATVTITGPAITTTSSHYLFRQGSGGQPGVDNDQKEITGLLAGIDDDGTLQGLAPASAFVWSSIVDGNSGTLRAASENLIERLVHRTRNRSGDGPSGLWAGDGVYRYLVNQLKGRQRIVNDLQLRGGHTAVDFTFGAENLPLARDMDAPEHTLWGVDYSAMKDYVQTDWEWEDEMGGGSVLRLSPDRTHEYEAVFFTFRERGYLRRNSSFRIDDLEAA